MTVEPSYGPVTVTLSLNLRKDTPRSPVLKKEQQRYERLKQEAELLD